MIDERYTPLSKAEGDALLRDIADMPPVRWETAGAVVDGRATFVRPMGVQDAERLTARERASLRGWNIDPEVTPGNPHAFGVRCDDRECPCHGRTFRHYLRGA